MNPPAKTLRVVIAGAMLLLGQALTAANLYEIPLQGVNGATNLTPYKGKVLLVVNVASQCGLTPQYGALEAVYRKHREAGLVVLGFPCNQFGGQEPGSNAEIRDFCTSKFDVTFPVFDKIDVNGEQRHPLYTALSGPESPFPGKIGWNFTKFLIGRDGRIIKRFEPKVSPDSPEVLAAIETALAEKS